MRTDTATFRTNVFKSVRALGVNSVRSKIVAQRIVGGIAHGSYNSYGEKQFEGVATLDTIELKLDFCWNGSQIVDVIVDGVRVFGASTNDHVLVSTAPTPIQEALRPKLETAMEAVCEAVADASRAWDAANGDDASHEGFERRHAAVETNAAVVAARAAYRALVNQSLASNRHAHIAYVDPALHGCYSDDVKSERGSRPRGHIRHDEIVSFYQRLDREAANDDETLAQAV